MKANTLNSSKAVSALRRLLLALGLLSVISAAQATTVSFNFSPAGLGTMDGIYYYTWSINPSGLPNVGTITAATLTYNNAILTSVGQNNPGILWTHLLDTSSGTGTTSFATGTDNDNGSDAFTGRGLLLGKELFPALNVSHNFSYNLDLPTLKSFLADGHFAIGIDPDCHYTDSSIVLRLTYSTPDAGSTAGLLGVPLLLLGLFRRMRG